MTRTSEERFVEEHRADFALEYLRRADQSGTAVRALLFAVAIAGRIALMLVAALIATFLVSEVSHAESYPIIAFGNRTYVAETTESRGTVLVRVYRRTSSSTWHRYGGFTVPAEHFAARRAEVKRDPEAASAAERVYFTGRVIGSTPFRPSSPLYREPRLRRKQ